MRWRDMTFIEKLEKYKKMYEIKIKEYEQKASEAIGEDKLYLFVKINFYYGCVRNFEDSIELEKEMIRHDNDKTLKKELMG